MSRWYEFYKDRMNERYLDHVRNRYRVFLDLIEGLAEPDDNLLEIGCGPGNITRCLVERGLDRHTLIDSDPSVLELAKENLRVDHRYYGVSRKFVVDVAQCPHTYDLFEPDVIHSHGLLEHFDDSTIRKIIDSQLRSGAHALIHYVPGHRYAEPSFGDERLLSPTAWTEICAPDDIVTFNRGFDYALIWRQE